MRGFVLLTTLHATASFRSAGLGVPVRMNPLQCKRCEADSRILALASHEDWAEKLIDELEGAAELAQRGAAISDVLRQAKAAAAAGAEAAREADKEMKAKLRAAEEKTAQAMAERDAAITRASAAEAATSRASEALAETEEALKEARDKMEAYKKEAAKVMGQLDDAYEFEQDRVAKLQQALEENKKALKAALTEAKLAAAREASAAANVEASNREKSEVELKLEEERKLLEGCLVDARTENDALLCRVRIAESKIGRKRRAVRNFMSDTTSRLRKLPSQIRSLKWHGPGTKTTSSRSERTRGAAGISIARK